MTADRPALLLASGGERSSVAALRLTRAATRFAIRLTGGCGHMGAYDGLAVEDALPQALEGFGGALIFGGTRMLPRGGGDPVPSVCEAGVLAAARCPRAISLGVAPRTGDARLGPEGLVIFDDPRDPYVTVVHPEQEACLLVQKGVDDASSWDAEWQECLRLVRQLREFGGWSSALVVWNGGGATERELLATARLGWPVLLARGSGRSADRWAGDDAFRAANPNVLDFRASDPSSLRCALASLGAFPGEVPVTHAGVGAGAFR